jgi:Tol biopolymer transport system component
MITDDEVLQLIEQANPVPPTDRGAARKLQASDVASYIAELRVGRANGSPVVVEGTPAKPIHRPFWLLATAASVAAIVTGALVLVARDADRTADEVRSVSPAEPLPTAPYYLDLETSEQAPLTYARPGSSYHPSPDGSRMLTYTAADVLAITNADGSGAIALDLIGPPQWEPARWSPDGTRIVYEERIGDQLGNLFVHELATGSKTQITDFDLERTPADWYWLGPSFSPDGRRVIYHLQQRAGSGTTDVWSVPATGGDPELLIENAAFPRYLPDGSVIYVSDEPFGTELWITDPEGSSRMVVEAPGGIEQPAPSPDGSRVAYKTSDGIHIVEVRSGEAFKIDLTHNANRWEWADDHTLLISPE